jgi:uncharacterized membrane protein
MYEFLLTIHVLAAVIWVGGGIAMHILGRRVLKRGDNEEIYKFSKEINIVALRLYAPMSLILLVAGILLVNEAGYEFSQLWITLAFIGWGFSFLVGIGYYGPQDKKLQALVAAEGPNAPGVAANVRQALTVNSFEILILLLVVVDMTTKPGL